MYVLLVMLYDTSFKSVNETIECDLTSESYIDLYSFLYMRLFKNLKARILKSIVTWC